LGCGQLSVGGEAANRVTIKRCYQRQCGAAGVDSLTLAGGVCVAALNAPASLTLTYGEASNISLTVCGAAAAGAAAACVARAVDVEDGDVTKFLSVRQRDGGVPCTVGGLKGGLCAPGTYYYLYQVRKSLSLCVWRGVAEGCRRARRSTRRPWSLPRGAAWGGIGSCWTHGGWIAQARQSIVRRMPGSSLSLSLSLSISFLTIPRAAPHAKVDGNTAVRIHRTLSQAAYVTRATAAGVRVGEPSPDARLRWQHACLYKVKATPAPCC
jgi:hypothetical protein